MYYVIHLEKCLLFMSILTMTDQFNGPWTRMLSELDLKGLDEYKQVPVTNDFKLL